MNRLQELSLDAIFSVEQIVTERKQVELGMQLVDLIEIARPPICRASSAQPRKASPTSAERAELVRLRRQLR